MGKERTAMPQGTIKDFDITTGSGTVVQDDLHELLIDSETFRSSGLQELRLGQRVRFERAGDRATNLTLVSF
jgi:cold shock CspA family protein